MKRPTPLFVDIETTATDPWSGDIITVQWALGDGEVNVERRPLSGEFVNALASDIPKVSHTLFDSRFLTLAGFAVGGDWHDTRVMAHVLNENTPMDLDWLTHRYAGITKDKRIKSRGGRMMFLRKEGDWTLLSDYEEWDEATWADFTAYGARDITSLRDLYWSLYQRLEESDWLTYFFEESVPLTNTIIKMESHGLPVDLEATKALADELEVLKDESRASLLARAGLPQSFNLNSQPQMVAYLFGRHIRLRDRLPMAMDPLPSDQDFEITKVGRLWIDGEWLVAGRGLPATPHNVNKVTGEKSKLPSVSSPDLLYYVGEDEWVRDLCMTYRKYEKLLTTYLRRFPEQAHMGRLYGRFNQAGTVTGRLSSSGPNLQNQPSRGPLGKRVRSLFKGRLLVGDFDQLEMRLMGHFSEDPNLLRVFRDGLDPHVETMRGIFGDVDPYAVAPGASIAYRDASKQLNYAMGYGAGPRKVAQTLSNFGFPTTPDDAKGYLGELSGHYRVFFKWKKGTVESAKRKGSVRTLSGRRRRLRGAFRDTADWKAVSYGERQAVNAIIQGSAADIINHAMVNTDKAFPDLKLLAQVHDELVWEYDEQPPERDIRFLQTMVEEHHGYDIRVPMGFTPVVCDTWAEKGSGGADWWQDEEDDEVDSID